MGFFEDNVTVGGHQANRARSWGHKGHSGVQTPRPSLCNIYILLNFKLAMLQALNLAPFSMPQRWSLPQVLSRHGFWHVARP